VKCDRQLFEKLKALKADELTEKTKRYLTKSEVNAVMGAPRQNRGHVPNPDRRKRIARSSLLARPKRSALYPSSPASRTINQKKTPARFDSGRSYAGGGDGPHNKVKTSSRNGV
jgi:hypothetical protein